MTKKDMEEYLKRDEVTKNVIKELEKEGHLPASAKLIAEFMTDEEKFSKTKEQRLSAQKK